MTDRSRVKARFLALNLSVAAIVMSIGSFARADAAGPRPTAYVSRRATDPGVSDEYKAKYAQKIHQCILDRAREQGIRVAPDQIEIEEGVSWGFLPWNWNRSVGARFAKEATGLKVFYRLPLGTGEQNSSERLARACDNKVVNSAVATLRKDPAKTAAKVSAGNALASAPPKPSGGVPDRSKQQGSRPKPGPGDSNVAGANGGGAGSGGGGHSLGAQATGAGDGTESSAESPTSGAEPGAGASVGSAPAAAAPSSDLSQTFDATRAGVIKAIGEATDIYRSTMNQMQAAATLRMSSDADEDLRLAEFKKADAELARLSAQLSADPKMIAFKAAAQNAATACLALMAKEPTKTIVRKDASGNDVSVPIKDECADYARSATEGFREKVVELRKRAAAGANLAGISPAKLTAAGIGIDGAPLAVAAASASGVTAPAGADGAAPAMAGAPGAAGIEAAAGAPAAPALDPLNASISADLQKGMLALSDPAIFRDPAVLNAKVAEARQSLAKADAALAGSAGKNLDMPRLTATRDAIAASIDQFTHPGDALREASSLDATLRYFDATGVTSDKPAYAQRKARLRNLRGDADNPLVPPTLVDAFTGREAGKSETWAVRLAQEEAVFKKAQADPKAMAQFEDRFFTPLESLKNGAVPSAHDQYAIDRAFKVFSAQGIEKRDPKLGVSPVTASEAEAQAPLFAAEKLVEDRTQVNAAKAAYLTYNKIRDAYGANWDKAPEEQRLAREMAYERYLRELNTQLRAGLLKHGSEEAGDIVYKKSQREISDAWSAANQSTVGAFYDYKDRKFGLAPTVVKRWESDKASYDSQDSALRSAAADAVRAQVRVPASASASDRQTVERAIQSFQNAPSINSSELLAVPPAYSRAVREAMEKQYKDYQEKAKALPRRPEDSSRF
jgi:hypothetical protein